MRKKKTAVEWLYDTIITFPKTIDDLAHNARSFKQAKAMEKEQIKDAYKSGESTYCGYYNMDEHYYNETYGKE